MSRAPATRRTPQRRPARGRATRARQPSMLDRAIAALPVSEATLRRLTTGAILAVIGIGVIAVALFFDVPQTMALAVAEEAGAAGFRVAGIEVTGTKHMSAMTVYSTALDQQSRAMPLVDVAAVRQRLLAYPWVADAQVSRRLPDKLVINIVEREPAAVWQNHGTLTLIDKDGHPLERILPEQIGGLPLVIGEGANLQTPAYHALLDAAPALKPLVRAATWVGNRRWNLTFQSGETLALPEDDPAGALVKFAELDGARSLLGKGWLRFDMRDPAQMVLRKPATVPQAATESIATGNGTDTPATLAAPVQHQQGGQGQDQQGQDQHGTEG